MRNKILLILFSIIIVLGSTGCVSKSDKAEVHAEDILNSDKETSDNDFGSFITDAKILVVYFSKSGENYNVGSVDIGNTAMMASYIKEYLNADSFEIVPVKKYSDKYKESTEEAKKEQKENARPKIKNDLKNLDDYGTVFIGYPIWWGDMPQILYTFLEKYDFTDKTVIPFNTHEGSGSANTYNTIKNKLTTADVNTDGLALQGSIARTEEGKNRTITWLKELGY